MSRRRGQLAALPLSIATGNYDRVRGIIDGRVPIEGCDVSYMPMSMEEGFYRAATHHEFDVAELSGSSYIVARSRGIDDYIAVPVFLSRMFRHSAIYVRSDAGIARPEDLRGREVGVPVYAMTAALWARGMLEEDYGVTPSAITWLTGGLEQPGRYGKFPLNLPPDITVRPIPGDRALSDMLAKGEIGALMSARAPSCFQQGMPGIRRLFPDYRAAEIAWYRKTGLFPIMHMLGIRRALAERHPWLPASVLKAYIEAKRLCMEEMNDVTALRATVPWLIPEMEETRALMGDDFWRYGFKANLKELEVMTRWSLRQGLAARAVTPEELFFPSTLESARV
ncbi:MAG: ABC transporter substrate-binding protein [Betaproteobacteria bacterium]|nr:ABC transporter substrate-binding protein [Betaproteobacteria bacterium]